MSGILTKDTKISYSPLGGTSFTELELLMEVPEIGGTPEKVDVTTLADGVKKSIPGIKDLGDLAFKFLYENTDDSAFRILKGLETSNTAATFKVDFPDDTSVKFDAYASVKIDSASVNNALTFTANMSLQSEFEWTDPT